MRRVTTGLERWIRQGDGTGRSGPKARVGLVAHPASTDALGRHALELLHHSSRVRLERLFAPEHGLWGRQQDMEGVRDSTDPHTGLPVVSLYGTDVDSLRPRPADLDGLDAIVYDLQDVGCRYYTFVYTLSFLMEAAREAGIPVIVLDRPNPLGGLELEGPVLDPELSSFVGRYPVPVRHGMTTGELARMFNEGFGIGCELTVVPMEGWRRSMSFEATGLPWIPPSPNMPALQTVRVYPGGCLIEGTNLSEGRGTTTPFELVGAPWLDAHRLAESMRERRLAGVSFRAAAFRPMFQKHAGQACQGLQFLVSDPEAFRPFATYLVLLGEARDQDPDSFQWREEPYEFESERLAIDLLLGRSDLRPMLETGATLPDLEASWESDLREFRRRRGEFLIYPG